MGAKKLSEKAAKVKALRTRIATLRKELAALQGRKVLARDPNDAYMTPDDVAERLARLVMTFVPPGARTVLDPSAGDGALLRANRQVWGTRPEMLELCAVELQQRFEDSLLATGARPWIGKLEEYCSTPRGKFDIILTNPPYSALQRHMTLTLQLLSAQGICGALLCNNAAHGQDRTANFWRRCIRSERMPAPPDALPALRAKLALGARPKFRGKRGGMRDYTFFIFDAAWTKPPIELNPLEF